MKKFNYIFCTILILLVTRIHARDPNRLNHIAEPKFQFIHLNLDPDKESYSGTTYIDLSIQDTLSSIR